MQRYRRVISTNPKPQKLKAGHLLVNNKSKRKAGIHSKKVIVILRKNRKQSITTSMPSYSKCSTGTTLFKHKCKQSSGAGDC